MLVLFYPFQTGKAEQEFLDTAIKGNNNLGIILQRLVADDDTFAELGVAYVVTVF